MIPIKLEYCKGKEYRNFYFNLLVFRKISIFTLAVFLDKKLFSDLFSVSILKNGLQFRILWFTFSIVLFNYDIINFEGNYYKSQFLHIDYFNFNEKEYGITTN